MVIEWTKIKHDDKSSSFHGDGGFIVYKHDGSWFAEDHGVEGGPFENAGAGIAWIEQRHQGPVDD